MALCKLAQNAEWQKQGRTLDKEPMFRQMLQSMLADRDRLVAHMIHGSPTPVWSLEVGKNVPRLTASKPGATLPSGLKLHDGGVMAPYQPGEKPQLAFYGATMADLAEVLFRLSASQPVEDPPYMCLQDLHGENQAADHPSIPDSRAVRPPNGHENASR